MLPARFKRHAIVNWNEIVPNYVSYPEGIYFVFISNSFIVFFIYYLIIILLFDYFIIIYYFIIFDFLFIYC